MFSYANNARTNITDSPLTYVATEVNVTNASVFPSTYPYRLTIWESITYADPSDDPNMEIVEVTGAVGNTLTIDRGKEGTSAVQHVAAASVMLGVTAGTFEDVTHGLKSTIDGKLPLAHADDADAHHPEVHTISSHDTTVTGTELNDIKSKLDGIEVGATADQTAMDIVTLINASAEVVADANIASTLARDADVDNTVATHASNATAHHDNSNDPTSDQKAAMDEANNPSALNPFVTSNDVDGIDIDLTSDGLREKLMVEDDDFIVIESTRNGGERMKIRVGNIIRR